MSAAYRAANNTIGHGGDDATGLSRRQVIALAGAALLPVLPHQAGAAIPTNVLTVMYRPATADAPNRLDPAVQTALRLLEGEFRHGGFSVLQPSAEVYRLMDQGPGVVVTFADDAGFALIFSAYKNLRDRPGTDSGIAEVRLESRVTIGRHVLTTEQGTGRMLTRLDAQSREYGERLAMEQAADGAAKELAARTMERLRALTAAQINEMVGLRPNKATVVDVLALPQPAAVLAPAAAPTAPVAPAAPALHAPSPQSSIPAGQPPQPSPTQPAASPVTSPQQPPATQVAAQTPAAVAALPAPRQRFALIVGMSNYASVRAAGAPEITDLPGVAKDAVKVVRVLSSLGFGTERMVVLTDAQATGGAIRAALKRFAGQVGPEDVVVIFVSAHGGNKNFSASGYGMPILADFRPNDGGVLDFWELQSMARNLKGKIVWISDTCHSGGAANNIATVVVSSSGVQAPRDVRGPDAATVAGAAGPGQDFAILTASSPQEISWETAEGGLFTTLMLDALQRSKGAAPLAVLFSQQVAGQVVRQSREICRKANACTAHPQQTPIMAYGGSGDRIRL